MIKKISGFFVLCAFFILRGSAVNFPMAMIDYGLLFGVRWDSQSFMPVPGPSTLAFRTPKGLSFVSAAQENFTALKGPYLGQEAPGKTPQVFAPGIISGKADQAYPSFASDGNEFYFLCEQKGGWLTIKRKNEAWTKPRIIPFSKEYKFEEANVSPDGSQLLFCSRRPIEKSGKSNDLNLWIMERSEGVWNEPKPLSFLINSKWDEAFPALSSSGLLYFFRDCGAQKGYEILVSKYGNGSVKPPQNIGPAINSEKHECDPCPGPDERYLVFCSQNRKDGFGNYDLYISFKTERGDWTESINMGPHINTNGEEITPHVTPEGKYLFFASNRSGNYDIYWVDAEVIEKLKPEKTKRADVQNH